MADEMRASDQELERVGREVRSADDRAGRDVIDAGIDTKETAVIRAEIEETRARMGDTVEELGERLNPRRLKESIKQNIRDATTGRLQEATMHVQDAAQETANRAAETGRKIGDTVRADPLPVLMVAVGVAWLFASARERVRGARRWSSDTRRSEPWAGGEGQRSSRGRGAPESYGQVEEPGPIDRLKTRAGELGDQVKTRASDLANRAQDAAEHVTDRAQDVAGQVAGRAEAVADTVAQQGRNRAHWVADRFHESPVVGGAAVLALGLAVGLAVPETRKETALMGSARDRLVDKVREVAQETAPKIEHVAERVIEQAEQTAKDAAREEGLTSS